MDSTDLENLENEIGYTFKNKELLKKALTHTSYAYENNLESNEKLEFLGDSILEFVSSQYLYKNYPELKANQNFSDLSEELRNTENKISFSRQFYNDTVTMYNTKLQVFPSNIIANMFNFTAKELFRTENDEARKNVKVDFS